MRRWLRPPVWLRLRAAVGGNWTPDGILQLEGDANFSLSWAHEAHPKPTLHGVVFQKLNGTLPREAVQPVAWPPSRSPLTENEGTRSRSPRGRTPGFKSQLSQVNHHRRLYQVRACARHHSSCGPVEVQFTSAGYLNYPCRTPMRSATSSCSLSMACANSAHNACQSHSRNTRAAAVLVDELHPG
jgi:hypothetical protein